MKPVFCDTVYFVALLNPADRLHARAVAFSRGADRPLVTTATRPVRSNFLQPKLMRPAKLVAAEV